MHEIDLQKTVDINIVGSINQHSTGASFHSSKMPQPTYLEFFAGSGLVAHALKSTFNPIWANDICQKKADVYIANHGDSHFLLDSIVNVNGRSIPQADMSWASFPCQDLSLAGLTEGINGQRSGLVWEWLRIMDEMSEMPQLLVAENVAGLVSVDSGKHYKILHKALCSRGYYVGAIVLDAERWVPQSRPRVFIIAIKKSRVIPRELIDSKPNWMHSQAMIKVAKELNDFLWWKMPEPPSRKLMLSDIIEWNAACDIENKAARNLNLIPQTHRERLADDKILAAPGYKRSRASKQVLELRFDGIAGCLRTPKGGSSRQFLVLKHENRLATRLLTVRETARLMGAPDTFKIPGSYNDGYKAMGDAVAVPVARYLGEHLLFPLLKRSSTEISRS